MGDLDTLASARGLPPRFFFHNSKVAARGIFTSAVATGGCGLAATILFLFCTPPLEVYFELYAPQPFVQVSPNCSLPPPLPSANLPRNCQIYALALGKGGSVFMTILAVIGLIMNTSIAVVAASRLVFAVARDGVLPGSSWIGKVTADGRPKNAVTVMGVFGAVLLCTILPSNVAFTSLISAGGIREYALLLRHPSVCKLTSMRLVVYQPPSRLTP